MFHKSLMGIRYLIVLDDIWEVKAWDELLLCFPSGVNGSRIMVTTRDLHVATYIQRHSDPYLLPFLEDEESWELLQKKVFQEEERCPLELLSVGPLVAKECKGMPSLIIMIAGILSRKKEDPSFWLEVAYDISSHASVEESMKMIQSSYDQLEDHLKPCLLYMGLFPKGYEIPVSDLLKWWIAEEFVENVDTLELEETSKSCLYDLVSRNLVIVSKRRANEEMKCCIVLDQVREFCLRKIKEEKFMQSIVPYNPCRHVDSDEQRLCMYIHDTMKTDYKERESFEQRQKPLEFIAHPKFGISGRKNLFPLLNNLRLIRVLHLLDIYLENSWTTAFQSLTQLRFLTIFVKAFDFKWVSHLLQLQTLRVRSSYIMISPSIWKMEKLRHVDISEFSITMEENERVNFEESSDIVLHNMKTLGMCYMSIADMTPRFWGKFPNLEELRLNIDELGDVPNNSGSTLMRSDMFPSSLKVLCLSDIFLTEEIVSKIARLQQLETLKLSEIYFTGEKHWDLSDNVFERLKVLKLHHVFMTQWCFPEKSFPVLEKLVIKSCSKLEELPLSLAYLCPELELIKVVDCSDSVGNSALKIKKEVEELWGVAERVKVYLSKKDQLFPMLLHLSVASNMKDN
ncbi:putative late blight resistance protein homolog R1B-16 isoform X2 [Nicotiana sylvestris]|uniref:Late blight resistance protein homolog R1B-16 n=2 Tax=Nicotiana sylvestris TaxID=4096 RepID=A0A1U7UYZ5_NICSY|nr:PREDICTED: putative late blight resistance protein homolog R1B-16 [Nicotiana sylvestris]